MIVAGLGLIVILKILCLQTKAITFTQRLHHDSVNSRIMFRTEIHDFKCFLRSTRSEHDKFLLINFSNFNSIIDTPYVKGYNKKGVVRNTEIFNAISGARYGKLETKSNMIQWLVIDTKFPNESIYIITIFLMRFRDKQN